MPRIVRLMRAALKRVNRAWAAFGQSNSEVGQEPINGGFGQTIERVRTD
jgi:hypothetical protein